MVIVYCQHLILDQYSKTEDVVLEPDLQLKKHMYSLSFRGYCVQMLHYIVTSL